MNRMNIQQALGNNFCAASRGKWGVMAPVSDVGDAVVRATQKYLSVYERYSDGRELTTSIYSKNLRASAKFSARNARTVYLLGRMTLLNERDRKGIVRIQIIEYAAVAEAMLLDVIQAVGVNDCPSNTRPLVDARKTAIVWTGKGLFATKVDGETSLYSIPFAWLIRTASGMNVIDVGLNQRLHWLRKGRNAVHLVLPTPDRYTADLASGEHARFIVQSLRDACLGYKQKHGLPCAPRAPKPPPP